MKFYDCKTAPSPRRVRMFMAEKGIEIETVQVDLGGGEQFGDAYRAINPDQPVEVLSPESLRPARESVVFEEEEKSAQTGHQSRSGMVNEVYDYPVVNTHVTMTRRTEKSVVIDDMPTSSGSEQEES